MGAADEDEGAVDQEDDDGTQPYFDQEDGGGVQPYFDQEDEGIAQHYFDQGDGGAEGVPLRERGGGRLRLWLRPGRGEEGAASGQDVGDGEAGGEGARGQSAPGPSGSAAGRSILRRFLSLGRAWVGREPPAGGAGAEAGAGRPLRQRECRQSTSSTRRRSS
ncbi:hypothetical protein ZWY2020_028979 [Hordeum vulgare]|nr:hypothetical protein ZWY2020_028979 [Hordeum vulgare]